jgi:hypothetical protein
MDAEKVRQQEQYQMEEDRKQAAFNARQAKAQQPIVKEDRRLQNEKNKRRKSNDSTPISVQQSHTQPQQTMAPVRSNGSKTTPSVRTQIRQMALLCSSIFAVEILSLQNVTNVIIL